MFKSILIANRGEIAVRVMRAARRLGTRCIAVYSDADAHAMHVAIADEAYRIGPPPVAQSYLSIDAIIDAARRAGAEAIHPGYGFLSENPAFVDACEAAGLVFIGPPAAAIRAMGLKDAAKRLMEKAGVPVVPGYHGAKQEPALLAAEAHKIGYPVLIKARAGGGGKGMRRVDDARQFKAALESAQREATSSFGDAGVIIEKYITRPRHIEVQVFADGHGNALHMFERDCSLQRRHQKVIEEAPAPGMTPRMREAMGTAAVNAARAVGYRGAGTVEFIVDASQGLRPDRFYFMEMNTRLQVEHPVTEAITGYDLVEWQLREAAGQPLPVTQDQLRIDGHAFEARIYAEDAARQFMPATGRLHYLRLPCDTARVDTGVREGDEITPYYDPMIAKVIVHGPDRPTALLRLGHALRQTLAAGCVTNVAFLEALTRHPRVASGDVDTGLIETEIETLVGDPQPSPTAVSLAALAASGFIEQAGGGPPRHGASDLWANLVGWRQWSQAKCYPAMTWHGEPFDASITLLGADRFEIATPGGVQLIEITGRDGARVGFTTDGAMAQTIVVHGEKTVTIFLGSQAHTFDLRDELMAVREDASSADRVVSPMPGLVKLVHVHPGESVTKGDPLVVVEAMKMEHTLPAPRDGKIAEVLVATGNLVEDGAVLVRLEAAES